MQPLQVRDGPRAVHYLGRTKLDGLEPTSVQAKLDCIGDRSLKASYKYIIIGEHSST